MELQNEISQANLKVKELELNKQIDDQKKATSDGQPKDEAVGQQNGLVAELLKTNLELEKQKILKECEDKERDLNGKISELSKETKDRDSKIVELEQSL